MKIPSLVAALVLVLSGCQTASDLVGSGPLNLSTNVERYYNESYKTSIGPAYFVVSRDGRFSNYSFCTAGVGGCGGSIIFELIESCEKRSGQKCYIYAENGFVVWNGPVTTGGVHSNRIAGFSDDVICNFATVPNASGRAWETRERYLPHVAEAKKRGLTLETCGR